MISYNTLVVLAGSALLGAGAGVIGSFAVLRRRALTGDALSHATLPGLCLAFLVLGERSLPVMLLGALCTGVLGVAVITALRRWTRIKEDAAIGIVLGVFFGAGIALLGVVQHLTTAGSKAGLHSYIFGYTAGMTRGDVYLIAAMAAACVALIVLLYKEFKLAVFDPGFATAQGWPVLRLDLLLMTLVAVAVVIGLPAVGAVLMAALLILPAAAARFWTDRLGVMLGLAAAFGTTMALIGAAISASVERVPTGPVIVVTGSAIFFVSMLFAPRRGALARGMAQLRFRRRIAAGEIQVVEAQPESPAPVRLTSFEQFDGDLKGSRMGSEVGVGTTTSIEMETFRHRLPTLSSASSRWLYKAIPLGLIAIAGAALLVGWWMSLAPDDRPIAGWTIVIGCLVNIPCAVLGCYLVLRRMSLLGDAISHAVLPGIVLAFLATQWLWQNKDALSSFLVAVLPEDQIAGWPIIVGALLFGMLTAFLTHALKDFGRVPEDSSMGIVYTTLFAIGVILVTRYAAGTHLDVECVLYGTLDTVAIDQIVLGSYEVPRVLPTMLAMCGVVALFVALLWKELKIASFDAGLSTAMGIPSGVVHYLLMAVVAAATVTAFEAIGSILVIAMLIVPAATGHMLTDRMGPMIGWAIVVAMLSAVLGYIAAKLIDTNVSAMMSVAAGLQFGLAVFFAPQHGLVSKWWRNFSLSLRIAGEDVIAALYRAEEAMRQGKPAMAAAAVEGHGSVGGLAGWLAIPHLRRRGELRVASGGQLQLTDIGREIGRSIVRSHRLWETYLGEQTELPLDHLHEPAERMEHYIGREVQEQIAASVSAGDVDPHGREIPSEK